MKRCDNGKTPNPELILIASDTDLWCLTPSELQLTLDEKREMYKMAKVPFGGITKSGAQLLQSRKKGLFLAKHAHSSAYDLIPIAFEPYVSEGRVVYEQIGLDVSAMNGDVDSFENIDGLQETALINACLYGQREVVNLLLKNADYGDLYPYACMAIVGSQSELAKYLIGKTKDIDRREDSLFRLSIYGTDYEFFLWLGKLTDWKGLQHKEIIFSPSMITRIPSINTMIGRFVLQIRNPDILAYLLANGKIPKTFSFQISQLCGNNVECHQVMWKAGYTRMYPPQLEILQHPDMVDFYLSHGGDISEIIPYFFRGYYDYETIAESLDIVLEKYYNLLNPIDVCNVILFVPNITSPSIIKVIDRFKQRGFVLPSFVNVERTIRPRDKQLNEVIEVLPNVTAPILQHGEY